MTSHCTPVPARPQWGGVVCGRCGPQHTSGRCRSKVRLSSRRTTPLFAEFGGADMDYQSAALCRYRVDQTDQSRHDAAHIPPDYVPRRPVTWKPNLPTYASIYAHRVDPFAGGDHQKEKPDFPALACWEHAARFYWTSDSSNVMLSRGGKHVETTDSITARKPRRDLWEDGRNCHISCRRDAMHVSCTYATGETSSDVPESGQQALPASLPTTPCAGDVLGGSWQ